MARDRNAAVIERGKTSFGAQVPDLAGCVAVGETKAEVVGLIREATERYMEVLEEDGEAIPAPQSYELIAVSSPGTPGDGFRELLIGRWGR